MLNLSPIRAAFSLAARSASQRFFRGDLILPSLSATTFLFVINRFNPNILSKAFFISLCGVSAPISQSETASKKIYPKKTLAQGESATLYTV
jgi:hypothetical protein